MRIAKMCVAHKLKLKLKFVWNLKTCGDIWEHITICDIHWTFLFWWCVEKGIKQHINPLRPKKIHKEIIKFYVPITKPKSFSPFNTVHEQYTVQKHIIIMLLWINKTDCCSLNANFLMIMHRKIMNNGIVYVFAQSHTLF
jgi:hypothetical protein